MICALLSHHTYTHVLKKLAVQSKVELKVDIGVAWVLSAPSDSISQDVARARG
jgi:hypothetical protein